jgi:amino-acid N-acetyltransferase
MTGTTEQGVIRKPRVSDVPGIKQLIDAAVQRGALLPRTLGELYETLRDFHVVETDGGVGGCCALHVDMADLAEIRSLAIREDLRGRDMGADLVRACLAEARFLGIPRVYALTRVGDFFKKLGFREIDKHELPNKVFRDCVRCPCFPDCDEIAMEFPIGIGDSKKGKE